MKDNLLRCRNVRIVLLEDGEIIQFFCILIIFIVTIKTGIYRFLYV